MPTGVIHQIGQELYKSTSFLVCKIQIRSAHKKSFTFTTTTS